MKKFSSVILKIMVLSMLIAQLALASDEFNAFGSYLTEPISLSICGLVILIFGFMKNGDSKEGRDL